MIADGAASAAGAAGFTRRRGRTGVRMDRLPRVVAGSLQLIEPLDEGGVLAVAFAGLGSRWT